MNNVKEKQWLSTLTVKSNATLLVRDTLGCTCPREIFDHYQVRSHIAGNIPMVQLIMGERLLVRIVDAARFNDPEKTAIELLKEGLAERDRRNLNRFRLVIVGTFPPSQAQALTGLPETMDPKVHLHILPVLGFD
ncbi:MAG: hypothetical protein JRJ86_15475 [Deltaproteobacteria bacterium]|nr:hypothetical protein [Deltaproteobacteria bacterium]MBW2117265.1 hypothetical protein [Deltaproteobacteria bacterium]MBW2343474.1 hypothetical protein [Deltaproteobacteria bacterium]